MVNTTVEHPSSRSPRSRTTAAKRKNMGKVCRTGQPCDANTVGGRPVLPRGVLGRRQPDAPYQREPCVHRAARDGARLRPRSRHRAAAGSHRSVATRHTARDAAPGTRDGICTSCRSPRVPHGLTCRRALERIGRLGFDRMKLATLGVKFVLELGAFTAFAFWGATLTSGAAAIILAIAAPTTAIVTWGRAVRAQSAEPATDALSDPSRAGRLRAGGAGARHGRRARPGGCVRRLRGGQRHVLDTLRTKGGVMPAPADR